MWVCTQPSDVCQKALMTFYVCCAAEVSVISSADHEQHVSLAHADVSPTHQSPAYQSPVQQSPAHQPLGHQSPIHQSPIHQSPIHQPPIHHSTSPAHQPLSAVSAAALTSSSASPNRRRSSVTPAAVPDPASCPIIPGHETNIEIDKGKTGLGLSIVGGSDTLLV